MANPKAKIAIEYNTIEKSYYIKKSTWDGQYRAKELRNLPIWKLQEKPLAVFDKLEDAIKYAEEKTKSTKWSDNKVWKCTITLNHLKKIGIIE
tara:strand:+ start:44 stop:322 length:279 start_codon:yes stop_codon:yes gene_type:complete